MSHWLQPGDKVVAKYSGFRGKADNPWFAGTVGLHSGRADRCTVRYEDGDRSSDVMENEVMYAPDRDPSWGKGEYRGNDMLPSPCTPVTFQKPGVEEVHAADFKRFDADCDCLPPQHTA